MINAHLDTEDKNWASVILPPNLGIVGTVNMDESSHGFSRKVLDRAFTIELSDIDLSNLEFHEGENVSESPNPIAWPVEAWFPRAITLGSLRNITKDEKEQILRVIDVLTSINGFLNQAQLQVGFRTRDEIALFLIHALQFHSHFITRSGDKVDPLDLAIQMKILPRIIGGSTAIRRAVMQMLGWAINGTPFIQENEANEEILKWEKSGRLGVLNRADYPRTASRLCLMWERLQSEGFTSFWL